MLPLAILPMLLMIPVDDVKDQAFNYERSRNLNKFAQEFNQKMASLPAVHDEMIKNTDIRIAKLKAAGFDETSKEVILFTEFRETLLEHKQKFGTLRVKTLPVGRK
jgi:hypothetical protein